LNPFSAENRGGIIHVANIKGGVGKSTVATNLAACLSKFGKTLLIDLDVQGSSTYALGYEPRQGSLSSFSLLNQRFSVYHPQNREENKKITRAFKTGLFKLQQSVFRDINEIIMEVVPDLFLIPASSALFKAVGRKEHHRFQQNLMECKSAFEYIVIDTPSVWNDFLKYIFRISDLNLIPVTLSALSTKSLKDYLKEIRNLIRRYPTTRIRIVKNEVYGKKNAKLVGKVKTISENRNFLDSLSEMVRYWSAQSTLLLPQSIVFDLEIPETAAIQNSQDRGVPIVMDKSNSDAKKSFEKLTENIREVLNTLPCVPRKVSLFEDPAVSKRIFLALRVAAAFLILFVSGNLYEEKVPAIITPSQLERGQIQSFTHTFGTSDNIYKYAKYALYRFRAIVPSKEDVEKYVNELIAVYNYTRTPGERQITRDENDLVGATLTFYPPLSTRNPSYNQDFPIYSFFTFLVKDEFCYVTGTWYEYGEGGESPHKGIDIAAPIGTPVVSPIQGVAYNRSTDKGGNMVGIVRDDYVIFFAHFSKSKVMDGALVRKGDTVGVVGMTGRASGPHVHIGYGIEYPMQSGTRFGKQYFEVTDTKQFFYRQMYLTSASE
jgi:cellulose biosynthesis protein BcsQ